MLCLSSSYYPGEKRFTRIEYSLHKSKALGKSAAMETLAVQLCHCIYEHARQLTIAESGELSTAMFCAYKEHGGCSQFQCVSESSLL